MGIGFLYVKATIVKTSRKRLVTPSQQKSLRAAAHWEEEMATTKTTKRLSEAENPKIPRLEHHGTPQTFSSENAQSEMAYTVQQIPQNLKALEQATVKTEARESDRRHEQEVFRIMSVIPPFTRKGESWSTWHARLGDIAHCYKWQDIHKMNVLLPLIRDEAADYVFGTLNEEDRENYQDIVINLGFRLLVL